MPDRAKENSAIMRCRTRVVPLRTVNESLNGDAMREQRLFHLAPMHRIALGDISASASRLLFGNCFAVAGLSSEQGACL
jgi:hypothetical protein